MIENFQIQGKKGIGWIVFLGGIPLINFFVMLTAWVRDDQKQFLKKSPYFWITDSFHIGNAIFWSLPYFFVSIMLFIAFMADTTIAGSGFPKFLFLSYILFLFLIACFLVNHQIKYKRNLNQINQLITLVASKPNTLLNKDFLCSTIKTVTGNLPEKLLTHILKDLEDNFIIRCLPDINAENIHIELFPDKDSFTKVQVGNWTCKYCGGENSADKEYCPYCGAARI